MRWVLGVVQGGREARIIRTLIIQNNSYKVNWV